MDTIATLLARSLAGRGGDLTLTLDPAFQGLPDTAHGRCCRRSYYRALQAIQC
ncbi:MAG: hypothetical protein HYV94_19265 [Candidatus Rokubacteria bacterium]|nr:hypothetical protein [Candidatus Rokubacteria bacterium]